MRQLLLLLAFGFLTTASAQTERIFVTDTIDVTEAKDHFGKYYTFCEEVIRIQKFDNLDGKPTMVDIGSDKGVLTLVIWEDDAKEFSTPLNEWLKVGDFICAAGQISSYGGSPRLEIGTEKQIHK